MENLKIKVDKKSDVDLVVGMLVELGFELESSNVVRVGMVGTFENHIYSDYLSHFDGFDYTEKEITIDQLRDMVVLKRNDVGDATHENLMYPYVKLTDGWYYFDKGESNKWLKSTGGKPEYYEKLKPIQKEKTMKEWIYKDGSGEYVLTTDPEVANLAADAVEVPNGAETFNYFGDEGNQFFLMCSGDKVLFAYASDLAWREWGDESFDGVICLWQREKPQEKCADICGDVVKVEMCKGGSKPKHSHYKKGVSHLNVIDPYRIADLYDLHPCAEHIMKKSLCAGGRGHKDLLRDIQDIIDTAERWKEMIEEDNNAI